MLIPSAVVALLITSSASSSPPTGVIPGNGVPVMSASGPPTTAQTWYVALGIDICGIIEPDLPTGANSAETGFLSNGNGVLTIAPKNSSESGSNATLGRFVSDYKGIQLSSSELQYPGRRVFTNGAVCPKGTPDAGRSGEVIVDSWPNFTSKRGAETPGDPQKLLLQNGQLITMAFVPAGSTIPKPPAAVITNLISADEFGTTTPTSSTMPTAPGGTNG
jgi:hypothetical protein